jgi:hypothetical protein
MTLPISTYDDTLFRQLLLKKSRGAHKTSRSAIHEVFWTVCWDLKLAIEQQAPQKWEDADLEVMEAVVPAFAEQLEKDGWTVDG